MLYRKYILPIICLLCTLAGNSYADEETDSYYVNAGNNLAWYGNQEFSGTVSDQMDITYGSYSFSASLGYSPSKKSALNNARFEAELGFYSSNNEKQSNISLGRTSFIANSFYDFKELAGFKSYIGFGTGFSNFGLSDNASNSTTSPVYQAMLGFSYQPSFTDNTLIHLGYRYFSPIGRQYIINEETGKKYNISNHNFEGGVNISF